MLPPVRLYRKTGDDRVAVVSVEPSFGGEGNWLLRIATGPSSDKLVSGTTLGPFPEGDLADRFEDAVHELRQQGFAEHIQEDWNALLQDNDSRVRARAAVRLGWRQDRDYVDALLARVPEAVDDLCSIIDALGAIGDPKAIGTIRAIAERKLLSRRRSGVEALRQIGDDSVLQDVLVRTRDSLGPSICGAMEDATASAESVADAIRAVDAKRLAYTLDQVYELDHVTGNRAVRQVLATLSFDQSFVWRYVKSIFKRSMLRHDPVMFGWLAHRIEQQAKSTAGQMDSVKSGYDGVERPTQIFGRKTQLYVRRMAWRYLRQLSRYRPGLYTAAAAEAVIPYTVEDGREPRGLLGQFSECYLLHRVLFGGSERFKLDDRRLKFRFRDYSSQTALKGVREEAFPHLWDQYPKPYLRVLGASSLIVCKDFAESGLSQHGELLQEASTEEILLLLESTNEQVLTRVLAEVRSRVLGSNPEWVLLDRCVCDERELVLGLASELVSETHADWTKDLDRTLVYLAANYRAVREVVIRRTVEALESDESLRKRFTERILPIVRDPEGAGLDAIGRVVRMCLTREFANELSEEELLTLVFTGAPALQAVAAHVLCEKNAQLSQSQIYDIATHGVFAVREAGYRLLDQQAEQLQADPGIVFSLLKSDWSDSRDFAVSFLKEKVDWKTADFDCLMGLLDSNHPDVQDFGRQKLEEHWESLDPVLLANRLCEHPHPNMRRLAVRLVDEHMPHDADTLKELEPFVRVVTLEMFPNRVARDRLIDLIIERGLEDKEQAAVACEYLQMLLPIQGKRVFESVLSGLARIKIAWPELEMNIRLHEATT